MLKIDKAIYNINKTICQNIDLADFKTISRALISQNLLAQSRNLVEHIAVKAYGKEKNEDLEADWESIPAAIEFIKHNNKYLFLRKFHGFLLQSNSHYTPDHEGAERLILKYYQFYVMIRNFMKNEYQMDILYNLNKFPINTDHAVEEYHNKIVERLEIQHAINAVSHYPRMYVHKVIPFTVNNQVYYEIVLTPAYDTISKFDRFVCYSKVMVPSHYSIKMDIYYESIKVGGKRMSINILTEYMVSIRPCELNNFAKIFGRNIKIYSTSAEYIGIMIYLSSSGASLLDVVLAPQNEYEVIKQKMFGKSRVNYFENVLDESRNLILAKKAGSNIVRYLLHTLNNKVIKKQLNINGCTKLSNLHLQWGCIPFDDMPFATSLIQHNPMGNDLFESISVNERDHELVARYVLSNMSINSRLYTPVKELEGDNNDVFKLVEKFNSTLYSGHSNRRIERFGKNLYIREAYYDTKKIIETLQEESTIGLQGYEDAISVWLEKNGNVDSEEKRKILSNMFLNSRVSLIYGAAGTGKTHLINHVAQFMDKHSKLFLANTNPALENLRRKIESQNC